MSNSAIISLGSTLPKTFVHAQRLTTQTYLPNVSNTVIYDTEISDTLNEYNPATGIFTPVNSGVYSIIIKIVVSGSTTGTYRQMNFWAGSTRHDFDQRNPTDVMLGGNDSYCLTISGVYSITAGSNSFAEFYHNASVNMLMSADSPFSGYNFLTIQQLS